MATIFSGNACIGRAVELLLLQHRRGDPGTAGHGEQGTPPSNVMRAGNEEAAVDRCHGMGFPLTRQLYRDLRKRAAQHQHHERITDEGILMMTAGDVTNNRIEQCV